MSGSRLVRALIDILPDPRAAAQRYPIPSLIALVSTAYALAIFRYNIFLPAPVFLWLPAALNVAFFTTLAAAVAAEARQVDAMTRLAIQAGVVAACAAVFSLAETLSISSWIVVPAALIAIIIAGHTGRRAGADAFWRYNEVIWTSAGMTLVAAGCIAAGLAVVIEMLEYLFDLHIPDGVMRDLCIVIFGLVAPLSWLAQIPPSFDDGLGGRTPASFISDAVSAIVRYVLVWLVIAYALILHAYAVKILFQFAMPKGQVGWIVVAFAGAAVITAVLSYPSRNANWLVALYWKWWAWLLPVPALLLFIAVVQRVGAYGVTERRYMLVVLGLWMLALTALQGFRRSDDLRPVFLSLLAALVFAAIGPLGMRAWSVRAQAHAFIADLTAAGAIVDGRIAANAAEIMKAGSAARSRAESELRYLATHRGLDALRGLYAGRADDPFAGPAMPVAWMSVRSSSTSDVDADQQGRARAIAQGLGFATYGYDRAPVTPKSPTLFYDASSPFVIASGAGRVVIGPFDHYGTGLDSRTVDGGALGKLTVDFQDGVVTVTGNGGARQAAFRFDATAAVRDALKGPGQAPTFRPALVLARTSGNLGVSMALVHVAAAEDGNRTAYTRLGFYLIAGE